MRQAARQTGRPKLLQAMIDAFSLPDLRQRLLFTFAMLLIFRFVAHVPVIGVNIEALAELVSGERQLPLLLGMLDLFSGGAMRNLSIAAMGVYPYITASIIMQLLVPIIPRLQALSREGELGRAKLNQYTHWLTIPLAMLQGYGQLVLFHREGLVHTLGLSGEAFLPTAAMVLSMTAGTVFLVWLGERITEHGIGNGISIIIFGGIIAALPLNIWRSFLTTGWGGLFMLVLLFLAIAYFIVFVNEAQRRIPVQYSRSLFRSGRMYRQSGSTHIPLRVNSAGMIPLIFAMAVMLFPGTVASYFVGSSNSFIAGTANFMATWFTPEHLFYWGLYFLLVVGFTFFYTLVVFQQQNLAETLQRQGGFVPGIRPGRPTSDYLTRILTRVTLGGAVFLAMVAIMPLIARYLLGGGSAQTTSLMILSSTGLLIVVGVVLDTMRQLEAQLLMRRYEGFIR